MSPWKGGPPVDEVYDQAKADLLVGKYILVGITYEDKSENIIERKQVHGVVVSANKTQGIKIKLKGKSEGKELLLPPDLRTVNPAPQGIYTLKETGEEVVDPDFTTTWVFKEPEKHKT